MKPLLCLLLVVAVAFACKKSTPQGTITIALSSPSNDATFGAASAPPSFQWSMVSTGTSASISYKLTVVPVNSGQTTAQALKGNKPFFEKDSLSDLIYLPTGVTWIAGRYGWQITAKENGGSKATGASDVWTFLKQ